LVETLTGIAPLFSAIAAIASALAAWCSFRIARAIRVERLQELKMSKPVAYVLDAETRKFTLLVKNEGPGPASDVRIALAPAFEPMGQKTAELCHHLEETPAKQPIELGGPFAPGESTLFAGFWNDVPPRRVQLSILWTDGNGNRKGQNTIIESGFMN
jgi:hypothetical protein